MCNIVAFALGADIVALLTTSRYVHKEHARGIHTATRTGCVHLNLNPIVYMRAAFLRALLCVLSSLALWPCFLSSLHTSPISNQ